MTTNLNRSIPRMKPKYQLIDKDTKEILEEFRSLNTVINPNKTIKKYYLNKYRFRYIVVIEI